MFWWTFFSKKKIAKSCMWNRRSSFYTMPFTLRDSTIKNVAILSLYYDLRTLYQTREDVGKMLISTIKRVQIAFKVRLFEIYGGLIEIYGGLIYPPIKYRNFAQSPFKLPFLGNIWKKVIKQKFPGAINVNARTGPQNGKSKVKSKIAGKGRHT